MAVGSHLVKMLVMAICTNLHSRDSSTDNSTTPEQCILREPKLLAGETLSIAVKQSVLLHGNRTDELKYLGDRVALDIIDILREKYGFKYRFVTPQDHILGDQDSGVIGMLAKGEADMAATFLPVFTENLRFLRYSVSLAESDWVVLMKRPQNSAGGSSLLAPFDTTVWLLILTSLVAVGPVIYFIILIRVRLCKGSQRLTRIFPLDSCIWFVYGALMKQGSTLNPISDSSRLLFATWWIFITILTSFYTANLTAFLTLSRFTLPIEGAEDLARGSYHWVAHRGGTLHHVIRRDESYMFLNRTVQRKLGQFLDKSDEEILDTVGRSGVMFLRDRRSVDNLMFRDYINKTKANIEESKRCTFVVTPKSFMTKNIAFGYPRNSTLKALFDPVLQTLVEMGVVKHLLQRGLPRTKICPLDLGSSERQLQNADLLMTYMLVVSGFVISAAVFIGEIICKRCKRCQSTPPPPSKVVSEDMWATVRKTHLVPPPYSKMVAGGKRQMINGREYLVVNARLIPLRTPSAFLFQYAA